MLYAMLGICSLLRTAQGVAIAMGVQGKKTREGKGSRSVRSAMLEAAEGSMGDVY